MADISGDTTQLWCSDVSDPDSNVLKASPPPSVQQTGLIRGTPFARVWHNFYFNYILRSFSWVFEERYKIGAVVSYIDGTEPDFLSWRGTWSTIGTLTVGTDTVNFFERTA